MLDFLKRLLRKALSLLLFIYINPIENEKLNWQKVVYIPIQNRDWRKHFCFIYLFFIHLYPHPYNKSIAQGWNTLQIVRRNISEFSFIIFIDPDLQELIVVVMRLLLHLNFFVRLLSIHCVGLLLIQNVVPRFGINAFIFIVF